VLRVSGIDLVDNTPIYDVKPYIPYADCHTDATGSYADLHALDGVRVVFPEELLSLIPENKKGALIETLKDDPRPSYKDDGERVYTMSFGGYDVSFNVIGGTLTVTDVKKL